MLRSTNGPILAFFDSLKNLRLRQLALILKAGYDPNLMINARGQNGLQYMINYFGATDAHFRLQAPINKAAYLSIAKLLLDSGLDPNTVDLLSGETVIFDAIRFNDKDMVSLLLNYVDFSLRNKNGETALMCAARFGTKQVMRILLEHLRSIQMDGYFLRQRNRFGLTPLELARAENLDCAKLLTKYLITFGHHTSAVLNRASSYHQLLPHAYQVRAGRAIPAASAAHLYDEDSTSDFESDLLAVSNPYQAASSVMRPGARGFSSNAATLPATLAFYDPKAAEFNQYLLEQQDFAAGGQAQPSGSLAATGRLASWSGDDDDFFGQPLSSQSGTNLTRSRSCAMLNQQKAAKQQAKYTGQSGKKSAAGTGAEQQATGAKSSWESTSGAGGTGRDIINN